MLPAMLSFWVIVPGQLLYFLPMRHQLKYSFYRTLALWAALDLILLPAAAYAAAVLSLPYAAVMMALLLVFFGVFHACATAPLYKTLSVYAIVCALTEILVNAACAIEAQLRPEEGAYTLSVEFALLKLGLTAAAAVVLFWPFRRYAAELVDQLHLSRIWYMTLPFSVALIGMSLFQRPLKFETLFVNNVFRSFLFLLLFTLLLWILLCVMFYFVVSGILSAAAQRERIQLLETQESQFAAQRRYMEDSARARHDFRQTVRAMKELYHSRNYTALGQLINDAYDSLPSPETVRYCRNDALNALLNFYSGKAKENGIRTFFRIELPDRLSLSDVELCSIVGNVLENAFLACLDVPEEARHIHLTMLVQNVSRLFLVATNSHGGKLRLKNGRYLSSRRNGEGLGLKSIMTTASRYGGTVDFRHDEKEFFSSVMLPVGDPSRPEEKPLQIE